MRTRRFWGLRSEECRGADGGLEGCYRSIGLIVIAGRASMTLAFSIRASVVLAGREWNRA
jgi:hypothetical protein